LNRLDKSAFSSDGIAAGLMDGYRDWVFHGAQGGSFASPDRVKCTVTVIPN
jgi:hypothetical protein